MPDNSKRSIAIVVMVSALVLISAMAPMASAASMRRKVSAGVNGPGTFAWANLVRFSGGQGDMVGMHFNTVTGRFVVNYFSKENDTLDMNHMHIHLFGMVEFVDSNADGGYTYGTDELVKLYAYPHQNWSEIQKENLDPGVSFTSTHWMPGNGTFTFSAIVKGEDSTVNGTKIGPMDAKVNFKIENYAYNRDNSQLALFVRTVTAHNSKIRNLTGGDASWVPQGSSGIESQNGNATLYFSWTNTCTVDGVERNVVCTHVRNNTWTSDDGASAYVENIFLAYPRGDVIEHDPVIGASVPGSVIPGFEFFWAIAAVSALAILSRKKKSK